MKRKKKVSLKTYIFASIFILFLVFSLIFYLKAPPIVINKGLSKDTIFKIKNLVDKSPTVEGIVIVDVDLQRNMRHSVFVTIKDKDIQEMYDKFINGAVSFEVPFFTGEHVHDSRLIRVMNQEFVCSPFKETIAYRYAPAAGDKIKVVCAISIPPSFGEFKGIVGIYFKEEPDEIQRDQIRLDIKNISEDVTRDLK